LTDRATAVWIEAMEEKMEKHEWRVKSAGSSSDLEKLLVKFEENGLEVVSVFAQDTHFWVVGKKGVAAGQKPLAFG
jgi:hypothetical protein